MADRDYVSTDHEAYVFGEGADEVHQSWSLVWWTSQDETLRSERTQSLYHKIKCKFSTEVYILIQHISLVFYTNAAFTGTHST